MVPPFTILALVFEGEDSFGAHFLLATGAVFVEGSKKKTKGEKKVENGQGED